jgi:hypothetical protein
MIHGSSSCPLTTTTSGRSEYLVSLLNASDFPMAVDTPASWTLRSPFHIRILEIEAYSPIIDSRACSNGRPYEGAAKDRPLDVIPVFGETARADLVVDPIGESFPQ